MTIHLEPVKYNPRQCRWSSNYWPDDRACFFQSGVGTWHGWHYDSNGTMWAVVEASGSFSGQCCLVQAFRIVFTDEEAQ